MCTVSDTISLPPGKIFRAQEFLSQSRFGPGVARIPLRTLQELRGTGEHWVLCNRALGPELHVIDKLCRSKQGHSAPKGDSAAAKQIYCEFRGTMGICRTHMCDPNGWGSSYKSTFLMRWHWVGDLSFAKNAQGMFGLGQTIP